ncbi:hypothetical protein TNCV_1201671 [Trichonephila clavipes]|nr:hypothetical protein TNCV_1201671 [Trichonephila clavipes]
MERYWKQQCGTKPPTLLSITRLRDEFETDGTIKDMLKRRPGQPRTLTSETFIIGAKTGSRVGRNQKTEMRICDRWMQEGTTDRRGRSHPPQCTTSPEWSVRKTSIAWSTLDVEPQMSPLPMVW